MAEFLVSEGRVIERGSDQAKREAKEHVPGDRVKDAPAMARELRWRVRLANGYDSDEDARVRRKAKTGTHDAVSGASRKRKRVDGEEEDEPKSIFLHFKPRRWDAVTVDPVEKEKRVVKVAPSDRASTDGLANWSAWDVSEVPEGEEVTVESRKDAIVKVRRTAHGLERQRVQRVLENWTWGPPESVSAAPASATAASALPKDDATPPPVTAVDPPTEDVKMDVTADDPPSAA